MNDEEAVKVADADVVKLVDGWLAKGISPLVGMAAAAAGAIKLAGASKVPEGVLVEVVVQGFRKVNGYALDPRTEAEVRSAYHLALATADEILPIISSAPPLVALIALAVNLLSIQLQGKPPSLGLVFKAIADVAAFRDKVVPRG